MLFKLPFLSLLSLAAAVPVADFSRALSNIDARGKPLLPSVLFRGFLD